MPKGSILGEIKFNRASVISAWQSKKVFFEVLWRSAQKMDTAGS